MKQKQKNTLIVTAIVITCLCLTFVGFYILMFGNGEPQTAAEFAKEYGGSQAAYEEILNSNDCAFLQEKFDIAYNNNQREEPGTQQSKATVGFMTAANKRMEDIGCYK